MEKSDGFSFLLAKSRIRRIKRAKVYFKTRKIMIGVKLGDVKTGDSEQRRRQQLRRAQGLGKKRLQESGSCPQSWGWPWAGVPSLGGQCVITDV